MRNACGFPVPANTCSSHPGLPTDCAPARLVVLQGGAARRGCRRGLAPPGGPLAGLAPALREPLGRRGLLGAAAVAAGLLIVRALGLARRFLLATAAAAAGFLRIAAVAVGLLIVGALGLAHDCALPRRGLLLGAAAGFVGITALAAGLLTVGACQHAPPGPRLGCLVAAAVVHGPGRGAQSRHRRAARAPSQPRPPRRGVGRAAARRGVRVAAAVRRGAGAACRGVCAPAERGELLALHAAQPGLVLRTRSVVGVGAAAATAA